MLEKVQPPPTPHQVFLLPSLTAPLMLSMTAPEETAQTITGSLEDYKTRVLYAEKSILHPGLHPIVANAFEPTPTTNFSVEVVNRERTEVKMHVEYL